MLTSANKDNVISFFPICMPFIFLALLYWLEYPVWYWRGVVIEDSLAFFLILKAFLSSPIVLDPEVFFLQIKSFVFLRERGGRAWVELSSPSAATAFLSSKPYHKGHFVKTFSILFQGAPGEFCGEKPEKGASSPNFNDPKCFPFLHQYPLVLYHIPTTQSNSSYLCWIASTPYKPVHRSLSLQLSVSSWTWGQLVTLWI